MDSITFLPLKDVIKLHDMQIKRFGGKPGIRDQNLLISAVEAPKATYNGEFLNKTIFDMGGAYIYHLIKNHPFVDGNKRIGVIAGFTFMFVNGYDSLLTQDLAFELGVSVACSKISKQQISKILQENCRVIRRKRKE